MNIQTLISTCIFKLSDTVHVNYKNSNNTWVYQLKAKNLPSCFISRTSPSHSLYLSLVLSQLTPVNSWAFILKFPNLPLCIYVCVRTDVLFYISPHLHTYMMAFLFINAVVLPVFLLKLNYLGRFCIFICKGEACFCSPFCLLSLPGFGVKMKPASRDQQETFPLSFCALSS